MFRRSKGVTYFSNVNWWAHLLWGVAAAITGFIIPAVFVGIFHLPRNIYLISYFAATLLLMYGYLSWNRIKLVDGIRYHWIWGLIVSIPLSYYTVRTVLFQPASPPPQGLELILSILWLGIIYGAIDGLFLSVFPVFVTWKALSLHGWTGSWRERVAAGLFAIVASMIVIATYHLGYPECRNPQIVFIILGVAVQSIAYVITKSPLAPVISHITMHIAAVLHGLNTVSQLPPHYYQQITAVIIIWLVH